jgi:hypothetical protein
VYTYTRPLSVQAQHSRSCPIISCSCYNGNLVTWTVVCLTATKFKPLILLNWLEYESYITTDSQSPSLSWNKAPIWGLRPDFCFCQAAACLLIWGFLTRGRVYHLQLLLVLASAVIFGFESRGTSKSKSKSKLCYDRRSVGQSVLE